MRILRQPASAHTHASHTLCSRAACSQSRQAPSRAGSGQRGRARACMRATFCSAHIWAWRSRPPSCARGAEKSSVLCVAISRVCRGARPSFLVVYTCSLNVITRAVVNLTRIFILISPRPSLPIVRFCGEVKKKHHELWSSGKQRKKTLFFCFSEKKTTSGGEARAKDTQGAKRHK